jgi:hypothetical protein
VWCCGEFIEKAFDIMAGVITCHYCYQHTKIILFCEAYSRSKKQVIKELVNGDHFEMN